MKLPLCIEGEGGRLLAKTAMRYVATKISLGILRPGPCGCGSVRYVDPEIVDPADLSTLRWICRKCLRKRWMSQ